jgi:hypothetical protein
MSRQTQPTEREVTYSKCDKNTFSFDHMGDPSSDMSNPTSGRFEFSVEEMDTAVNICEENASGRGCYGGDLGCILRIRVRLCRLRVSCCSHTLNISGELARS